MRGYRVGWMMAQWVTWLPHQQEVVGSIPGCCHQLYFRPTLLGDKETLTLLPVERTNFNGHSMETTGKDLMQRKLALRHLYSGERSLPQVKARRCNNQH